MVNCGIAVQWSLQQYIKKIIIDWCNHMDEFQMYYAKWKKLGTNCYNLYTSIYMMF